MIRSPRHCGRTKEILNILQAPERSRGPAARHARIEDGTQEPSAASGPQVIPVLSAFPLSALSTHRCQGTAASSSETVLRPGTLVFHVPKWQDGGVPDSQPNWFARERRAEDHPQIERWRQKQTSRRRFQAEFCPAHGGQGAASDQCFEQQQYGRPPAEDWFADKHENFWRTQDQRPWGGPKSPTQGAGAAQPGSNMSGNRRRNWRNNGGTRRNSLSGRLPI